MLSTAAFNAFLKTLEEPPKHAKFILATTEKHKIIPTILSRCQVFNFNRIKTDDISQHLAFMANTENVTFEQEALQVIAQKADGGLRDACSIFDQMVAFTGSHLTYKQVVENLHVLDYDYYFEIIDQMLIQGLPKIMVTFDEILKKGFDGHNFLIGLGEHLRNLLVSKDIYTTNLLEVSENLKKRYSEQSAKCTLQFLLKSLSIISKTDVNYKSAKNQRLLVEITLMQLSYLTAPLDAEKKNDLTKNPEEPGYQDSSTTNQKIIQKISALQEPEIKFASKPTVTFDKLNIKSAFSLNELQQKPVQPQTNHNLKSEVEQVVNLEVKQQSVIDAVKKFADVKMSTGSRQIGITLNTANISFVNNVITLLIHNESQREQLQNIKQHFLDEIRQTLQNNLVQLEIELLEHSAPSKAYKPMDIFREMAEKNPAILELKKLFDLEVDY
jgi:DNA polymerase-3 subunit gamma/tau